MSVLFLIIGNRLQRCIPEVYSILIGWNKSCDLTDQYKATVLVTWSLQDLWLMEDQILGKSEAWTSIGQLLPLVTLVLLWRFGTKTLHSAIMIILKTVLDRCSSVIIYITLLFCTVGWDFKQTLNAAINFSVKDCYIHKFNKAVNVLCSTLRLTPQGRYNMTIRPSCVLDAGRTSIFMIYNLGILVTTEICRNCSVQARVKNQKSETGISSSSMLYMCVKVRGVGHGHCTILMKGSLYTEQTHLVNYCIYNLCTSLHLLSFIFVQPPVSWVFELQAAFNSTC